MRRADIFITKKERAVMLVGLLLPLRDVSFDEEEA
jgi:hypothetical protein